jgi:putative ABC transport system substrate-binding protein
VNRRDFITLLGGAAAAWPLAARAQPPARPIIGFLDATTAADSVYRVSAFREGLNEAGFIDGHNVVIDFRWAENQLDRAPAFAADLVRKQVRVIVVQNSRGICRAGVCGQHCILNAQASQSSFEAR